MIRKKIIFSTNLINFGKWFEPRSISSSCSERVSVVLKRTVGDSD